MYKRQGDKSFVYVLKDKQNAVKTQVQTGIRDNLDTQIISGINDGDEIVTSQSTASEIAKMVEKENRGPR